MTTIPVICTGNGTHRPLPMKTFLAAVDGWGELPNPPNHHGRPLQKFYEFDCRRCGREARMKRKTLRAALDGLRAAGEATLDISLLPF
jgi:hypothetical protein